MFGQEKLYGVEEAVGDAHPASLQKYDSTRSSMNESGMLPFKSSLSAIIVLGGLVLFSAL